MGKQNTPKKEPTAGGDADGLRSLLPTNRLVTVAEVAAALNVAPKSIHRRIKAGELPSFRIGNAIRIRPQDVVAYLIRAESSEETTDLSRFINHQLNGRSHGSA